ncbi:hypothetical protein NFI96_000119 [Prochilodus magdalenae]|nr:hypothetical protein NFI96_000119 [Prochilodus magdalenae]
MQRSSILDRIKSQIPTIDSDVSSSDLLKSVTEPFTYGNDDDCCDQKDDIVSLPPKELDDCKTLVATSHDFVNAAETESLCSESAELSKSLLHESNSDMITAKESTSPESTNSERERFLQTPAREICRKQSLESMHAQTYPILSLKPLENWDLDQVLQSLKHHTGYHKVENEKGEPQLFQPFKYTDYVNERPEVNVMEQLAAFCKKQASKKVAPMAISSTVESHELQRPYISSPAIIRKDVKKRLGSVPSESIQVVLALGYQSLFLNPLATHHLQLLQSSGMDVHGLHFTYPSEELLANTAGGAGEERFELLALKWLPTLSPRQAQELSPFEVGDRLWQCSVYYSKKGSELKYLGSDPALALCLQRVNAVKRLLELLGPEDPPEAYEKDQNFWRASYEQST